jgi:pimeloyl-ACP methyl ester carboxylesterase
MLEALTVVKLSKRRSRYDERISIIIDGLPPGDRCRLTLTTQDRAGVLWTSHASFRADERGVVDLNRLIPISGTYDRADAMGLFWSMLPNGRTPESTFFYLPDESQKMDLSLENSTRHEQISLERVFFDPETTLKIEVAEPQLRGIYYVPKAPGPHPTLLILGGSEGGFNEFDGALLAQQGIASLSLAYFKAEGLPSELVNIPLECVDLGMDWLLRRPEVDPSRFFVSGTSRGSELAVWAAVRHPDRFRGVILITPGSYVWSGLPEDGSTQASWTLAGEALPFISFDLHREELESSCPSYLPACERRLDRTSEDHPARLPVEKAQCPILLVSGTDDQLWASQRMANQLEQWRKRGSGSASGSPTSVKNLCYPGAGHLIWIPFRPTCGNRHAYQWGGNMTADAIASESSWNHKVHWILSL